MKMGYLIGKYPALSHTFILQEIQQLEKIGWAIKIASVNKPDRPFHELLPDEKRHANGTYYIKQDGIKGAFQTFIKCLFTNPKGFFYGLKAAIQLGGTHPGELQKFLFYFIEALMVTLWMRKHHLRHLHVHFAGPTASIALLCKKISGCLLSITVHGPDELSDATRHRLREKFDAADLIVCITHYAKSRVLMHSNYKDWHKAKIIRVGLNCEPFQTLSLMRHSKRDSVTRLLSIGRLAPAKGQLILLNSLAELIYRGYLVHLTLIGSGPLENCLLDEAQKLGLGPEHLRMTGGLNQKEVKEYIKNTDLFVLSSFAEGLPVVLMEALLSGLPCITTSIAGIPELIRHQKDGLLVPTGDIQAFADAIQYAIDNPEELKQMTQSGMSRVLAMHNVAATVSDLSQHFLGLQAS